jgi:hypothetical protein
MQCILYKIYFWKVFHLYYNLICILYALLCGQNFILVKSGCYKKSYADHRRRDLSFEIGDFVYLKVSLMRGLRRFKVGGKLAPRFIGPFNIMVQKGEVAYQLELPPQLSTVHDVFHISQLKKCLCVPEEQVPFEDLVTGQDLAYQDYPIKILETSERVMRNKTIKMCKVQWSNHT